MIFFFFFLVVSRQNPSHPSAALDVSVAPKDKNRGLEDRRRPPPAPFGLGWQNERGFTSNARQENGDCASRGALLMLTDST